ncbi:MAG TPA: hypothetical protein VKA34_07290 [Balneolales bacterium]|nr:hypothetical protein [Balneolales bacterium]
MKVKTHLSKVIIIIALLTFWGCSQSPEIADISMRLHDKYKTHFLHAEMRKNHDLFLIFRMDSTNLNHYQVQSKAHDIAAFAFAKADTPGKIQNITVRFQHIGAPAVIKDPHVHIYTFSTFSLK